MSTSALIGRSPIAVRRFCSHSGDGPFFTPRTRRKREGGAERRRRAEIERHLHRAGERALHRLRRVLLELADVGRAEIARDAVHAGAIGAVGRQIDLDHRIVEAGIFGVGAADRRIGRQVDDAVMIVGDFELGLRHQHAAAFDAADGADAERDVLAGDVGAGRREHAHHAGARIGRAADDLHRFAVAGIDHAHTQTVRVRMLLRLDHARDDEGRKRAWPCPRSSRLRDRSWSACRRWPTAVAGVEMLFEPGDVNFICLARKDRDRTWIAMQPDLLGPISVRALWARACRPWRGSCSTGMIAGTRRSHAATMIVILSPVRILKHLVIPESQRRVAAAHGQNKRHLQNRETDYHHARCCSQASSSDRSGP